MKTERATHDGAAHRAPSLGEVREAILEHADQKILSQPLIFLNRDFFTSAHTPTMWSKRYSSTKADTDVCKIHMALRPSKGGLYTRMTDRHWDLDHDTEVSKRAAKHFGLQIGIYHGQAWTIQYGS